MLYQVTERLGVAFATTLLALVQASILVFIQNVVQGREESALNKAGQYCLDNLINRLYSP
jgi:biopolymer transport protein ExbB/TolQ